MSTIKHVNRSKIVATLIFFCGIIFSGFSQESDTLDTTLLRKTIEKKLPVENRSVADQKDIDDLYRDLQSAGILTVDDLNNLIDTYLEEVLSIEQQICTQMIASNPIEYTDSSEAIDSTALFNDIELTENIDYLKTDSISDNIEIVAEIEEDSDGNELSASVSTGSYSGSLKDLPSIKKGIYFEPVGLIRTMIDLRNGPEKDEEYEEDEEPKESVILKQVAPGDSW